MEFWEKLLGFKPEIVFTPPKAEVKCYNCENTDVTCLRSSPWSNKFLFKCGYYTYVIRADFMGGALNENVAISKENYEDF